MLGRERERDQGDGQKILVPFNFNKSFCNYVQKLFFVCFCLESKSTIDSSETEIKLLRTESDSSINSLPSSVESIRIYNC